MTLEEIKEKISDIGSYILNDDIDLYYKYLSQLTKEAMVLDIATGWGKSAIIMALSNPKVLIHTVDTGYYPIYQKWARDEIDYLIKIKQQMEKHEAKNVYCSLGDATKPLICEYSHGRYDLLHIDGESGMEDLVLKNNLEYLKDGGLLLLRNYNRFKKEADEICKNYQYLESKGLIQVIKKNI